MKIHQKGTFQNPEERGLKKSRKRDKNLSSPHN